MKVAFLDRDGTIIKDYPDREWANVKIIQYNFNDASSSRGGGLLDFYQVMDDIELTGRFFDRNVDFEKYVV